MAGRDFALRSAADIADQLAGRRTSAGAVLDAQLDVIDKHEPRYGAYITRTSALAKTQAAAVDTAVEAGADPGPLAGVPLAVKDIFDIVGQPTTAGMGIHQGAIAERDATVITRLVDAGALIIGKTTLTEGVYAEHRPPFPAPRNPWHADYWSGASSSGSGVAVAAGLCTAALGSETGGSIKLPAAANGVTAIKPTWGRVSRHGVFELAATLDHVGPFANSVIDAAMLLKAIAGPDDNDPTAAQVSVDDYVAACARGIDGLTIGIDRQWLSDGVDAQTRAALDDAVGVLEQAGAQLANVTVPDVSDMIWDWFGVCAAQTALAHADTFPAQRDAYGPALAQLLDMGNALSATDYQKLLLRRADFRGRLDAMFTTVDLLALPVLGFPVPTLERMQNIDDDLIAGLHRFTCPFNLSGNPGIVLPCGITPAGLPIVFQLVGRHFDEALLCAAGNAYQERSEHHRRVP